MIGGTKRGGSGADLSQRIKQAAAAGLIKGCVTALAWLGLPAIGILGLAVLTLIFFFGYAGLAQNLTLAPVAAENLLNDNFKPVLLSPANKKLIAAYRETALSTVPESLLKDHYRQESAYRLTWGLLAALDTVIYQLDERRQPAAHARKLMTTENSQSLFEYKDSKITVVTTTETSSPDAKGNWRTTRTTKRDIKNIKLLTLARTFAGDFRHLYKETTTTNISESSGVGYYSVTTVVTTKENLSGIDTHPSNMEKLRQILIDNDLNDETDLDLVLALADTYDEEEAELDGTTKNFWQAAMEQADWPKISQAADPGSMGPGIGTTVPGSAGSDSAGPDSAGLGSTGGYPGNFPYWPTPGSRDVSSPFGMRIHPIKKVYRMHAGIDIAAPGGTAIVAVAPGRVIANRYSKSYGFLIVIDHGDGISTSYNHMLARSPLPIGSGVAAGQVIGKVGSSGLSTGNHLHFELRVDGQCRDPLAYSFDIRN